MRVTAAAASGLVASAGARLASPSPASTAIAAAAALRAFSTMRVSDFASLPSPAKGDWNAAKPHAVRNFVGGKWEATAAAGTVLDCFNGDSFMTVPETSKAELKPFVAAMTAVPKTGLHNPFKAPERYLMLGRVSNAAAAALRTPEIAHYFATLIARTSPKSYAQAMGEVTISAQFLDNFSGDQVRYLARSFAVPGDHAGQESAGYRFPYGPVAIVVPFNFPLEIPVLQMMGALYMGNRPTLKCDSRVSVVMEQFLRLLHFVGLPAGDVDMLNADGATTHALLMRGQPRMTLFTGSSRVAETLARDLHGRIKIEDAGFDWKILGPDVSDFKYVAWVSDQDAYACSGQKCSAQSMLFAHRNWVRRGLYDELATLAGRRKLEDCTIGPVLTWTTERMKAHIDKLLTIPGSRLLFGGQELPGHTIPACYGALQPTAVYVPLAQIVKARYFGIATTEVFGPLQVVTEYTNRDVHKVVDVCNRMTAHLTAAVVSNNDVFRNYILGNTVNGTTYAGIRARTTGAPQNHWFGPSGDPRGAGIGTREAIQLVWSSHREIIRDVGPIAADWTTPAAT